MTPEEALGLYHADSDDITKPKRKKKGQGRIGGQRGHPRNERRPFCQEEMDEFHDYTCPCCPACHGEVTWVDGAPRVIQQLEIKEVPVIKHEHRSYPMWCQRCQKIHYAPFPAAIKKMFAVIHEREKMSPAGFQQALENAKATIMTVALNDVPSRLNKKGQERNTEVRNIANRFRTHGDAYFTFITTPGMDPTHNLAEQAMRFIVIDRHITQGTRRSKGRQRTERLWTVIATCGLQGRSAFQFIYQAVHAYFHGQPAPSLLSLPP